MKTDLTVNDWLWFMTISFHAIVSNLKDRYIFCNANFILFTCVKYGNKHIILNLYFLLVRFLIEMKMLNVIIKYPH